MTETKVARTRIRTVRFKRGGELRLLPPPPDKADDKAFFMRRAKKVVDVHDDRIAGFAIVVWAPDGKSTVTQHNDGRISRIPRVLIGDFVKARLLGDTIEDWVIQDIQEEQ